MVFRLEDSATKEGGSPQSLPPRGLCGFEAQTLSMTAELRASQSVAGKRAGGVAENVQGSQSPRGGRLCDENACLT